MNAEASTILVTFSNTVSWTTNVAFNGLVITGFSDTINSASFVSIDTTFGAEQFSFTNNSISLNFAAPGDGNYTQGSTILVNVNQTSTPAIPEPSTVTLFAITLVGLTWSRRRKS